MNSKRILVGVLAALCFSTASAHRSNDFGNVLSAVIVGGIVYQALQPREVIVMQPQYVPQPVYIAPPPPVYVTPYIEDCSRWHDYTQINNCHRRNTQEYYRAQQYNENLYRR